MSTYSPVFQYFCPLFGKPIKQCLTNELSSLFQCLLSAAFMTPFFSCADLFFYKYFFHFDHRKWNHCISHKRIVFPCVWTITVKGHLFLPVCVVFKSLFSEWKEKVREWNDVFVSKLVKTILNRWPQIHMTNDVMTNKCLVILSYLIFVCQMDVSNVGMFSFDSLCV